MNLTAKFSKSQIFQQQKMKFLKEKDGSNPPD